MCDNQKWVMFIVEITQDSKGSLYAAAERPEPGPGVGYEPHLQSGDAAQVWKSTGISALLTVQTSCTPLRLRPH